MEGICEKDALIQYTPSLYDETEVLVTDKIMSLILLIGFIELHFDEILCNGGTCRLRIKMIISLAIVLKLYTSEEKRKF